MLNTSVGVSNLVFYDPRLEMNNKYKKGKKEGLLK